MPRQRDAREGAKDRLTATRVPGAQQLHKLLDGDEEAAGRLLAATHGPLVAATGDGP